MFVDCGKFGMEKVGARITREGGLRLGFGSLLRLCVASLQLPKFISDDYLPASLTDFIFLRKITFSLAFTAWKAEGFSTI